MWFILTRLEAKPCINLSAPPVFGKYVVENMQMGPKRISDENQTQSPENEPPAHTNKPEEIPTVEYPEDEINPNDIPF